MLLKVAQLGQPVLRQPAAEVPSERIGAPEFQTLLSDMADTLAEQKGVGLAAPQVFVSERVFLAAIVPGEEEDDPPGIEVFINPVITPLGEEKAKAWEGCLSFAELLVLVPRHKSIRIDYLNAQGEAYALEAHGFAARVLQHEFDHLQGILTIDRAESTRDIIKTSEIDAVREAEDDEEDSFSEPEA